MNVIAGDRSIRSLSSHGDHVVLEQITGGRYISGPVGCCSHLALNSVRLRHLINAGARYDCIYNRRNCDDPRQKDNLTLLRNLRVAGLVYPSREFINLVGGFGKIAGKAIASLLDDICGIGQIVRESIGRGAASRSSLALPECLTQRGRPRDANLLAGLALRVLDAHFRDCGGGHPAQVYLPGTVTGPVSTVYVASLLGTGETRMRCLLTRP